MSAGPPASGRPLFGTDGIRAPAGDYPLDRRTVALLGCRLGERLARRRPRPLLVLGGDTRESTPEICAWLAGGLAAAGARCRFAGTLPTPGVSFLVQALGAAGGVAVSASHNPHTDNGIKLFDHTGGKWAVDDERALEAELQRPAPEPEAADPPAPEPELVDRYLDSLAAQLPGRRPLAGLRVLLDSAHGAASGLAAALFRRLGAETLSIFDRPDGRNINLGCGSTHPRAMAEATAAEGCDLGLAFDGDADRVIWADEAGQVRDGDALLYLWAGELAAAGRLDPPRVVATSMTNLGLERALAARGIELVRCAVGDRAVAETMRRERIVLGGEQSGHIIHRALAPTGDGLQTAIHLAALARRAGRPLSELAAPFKRYPQTLVSVRVRDKPDLETVAPVAEAARRVREELGDGGRLVLRYSGTEPLARVMIEAADPDQVRALAASLARTIEEELGDG